MRILKARPRRARALGVVAVAGVRIAGELRRRRDGLGAAPPAMMAMPVPVATGRQEDAADLSRLSRPASN